MARTSVWEKSHECRSKRVAVFAVVDCHDLNKDTKPDIYCCHLPFLSFFLSFSPSPFFLFVRYLTSQHLIWRTKVHTSYGMSCHVPSSSNSLALIDSYNNNHRLRGQQEPQYHQLGSRADRAPSWRSSQRDPIPGTPSKKRRNNIGEKYSADVERLNSKYDTHFIIQKQVSYEPQSLLQEHLSARWQSLFMVQWRPKTSPLWSNKLWVFCI